MTALQIAVLIGVSWIAVAVVVGLVFGAIVRRRDDEQSSADQDRAELQTRHGSDWWDWDR